LPFYSTGITALSVSAVALLLLQKFGSLANQIAGNMPKQALFSQCHVALRSLSLIGELKFNIFDCSLFLDIKNITVLFFGLFSLFRSALPLVEEQIDNLAYHFFASLYSNLRNGGCFLGNPPLYPPSFEFNFIGNSLFLF